MIKRGVIIAGVIFLTCASIEAILPPLFEDIAEIKGILDDQRLGKLLESGESIAEIKKVKEGYLITTNHHNLLVKVSYKPIPRPGPAQFELEFQTAEPLQN